MDRTGVKKIIWLGCIEALVLTGKLLGVTWTGATDAMWTTTTNWDGPVPDAVGAQAVFIGVGVAGTPISLGGSSITVGSLQISATVPAITIEPAGGDFTLQSTGENAQILFSGNTHTISVPMTVSSPLLLAVQSSGTNSTLSGGITGGGSIGFIKQDLGTLILKGGNSFSGPCSIEGGALDIQMGSTSLLGGITVNTGTQLTFDMGGTLSSQSPVILEDGEMQILGGSVSCGTLSGTSSGNLRFLGGGGGRTLTITQAADATLASRISGGTVTDTIIKSGGATLTLSGNNGFIGTFEIAQGVLAITNDQSVGTVQDLKISNGSILQIASNGAPAISFGDVIHVVTIDQNARIDTNGKQLTFAGVVGGMGVMDILTKEGAGTLILSAANTYGGGTILNAGQLVVANAGALSTGPVTLNGGTLSTSFNLSNNFLVAGTATLGIGANTITLSGAFTGDGILIKTGSGILNLTGANSFYEGTWDITAGTVQINSNTSLGTMGAVNLILRNSTLSVGSAGTINLPNPPGITVIGNNTIETGVGNLTIGGSIQGTGGWTKTGAMQLTLSNFNNYQGPTGLSGGTLVLVGNNSLGISSQLTLTSGTLISMNPVIFGNPVFIDGAVMIDTPADLTLLGGTTGTALLTKTGGGTLTFGGRNALGPLDITNGTVAFQDSDFPQSIGTLNGAGGTTLSMGNTSLRIHQTSVGLFEGQINGPMGRLIKDGGAALTVEGGATLGSLQVDAGTLTFTMMGVTINGELIVNGGLVDFMSTLTSIGSLRGEGGTIDFNANTVTINQEIPGRFAGTILGTGTLNKEGNAELILAGANGFSGIVNVNMGTLRVNGSLDTLPIDIQVNSLLTGSGSFGSTTVNAGGKVEGTGTYRDLTVTPNGQIAPGDPTGILTVLGLYDQQDMTAFDLRIVTFDHGEVFADMANVSTTNTELNISVEGSCFEGAQFDVLSATNAFDLWPVVNEPDACQFRLDLVSEGGRTIARLTSLNTSLFIGKSIDEGNPKAVFDYLTCLGIQAEDDIVPLLVAASALENDELNKALNQLHPGLFGGFSIISLDQDAFLASLYSEHIERTCWRRRKNKKRQSGWVAAIGNFTEFKQFDQLRGFSTQNGGVLLGYDFSFPLCAVLGGGLGYHYTNVDWDQKAGKASIDAVVGSLYGGYVARYVTVDGEILGGVNFYKAERNISFPGFSASAHNKHRGYFFYSSIGSFRKLLSGKRKEGVFYRGCDVRLFI